MGKNTIRFRIPKSLNQILLKRELDIASISFRHLHDMLSWLPVSVAPPLFLFLLAFVYENVFLSFPQMDAQFHVYFHTSCFLLFALI